VAAEERDPGLLVDPEPEARRHHADHPARRLVGHDRPSDDPGITAEPPLPEIVREDHRARRAGPVFLRAEGPAEERCDAEDLKETGGDGFHRQSLRPAVRQERQAAAVEMDGLARESVALCREIEEIGIGDVAAEPGGAHHGHGDQAVGLGQRQRTQDQRVMDAEGQRRDPDAQRRREDRGDGEARAPPQRAEGPPEIKPEIMLEIVPELAQGAHPRV